MQSDILLQQVSSTLTELKTSIEKFEKHPLPSAFYTEGLHLSVQRTYKILSAYLVSLEHHTSANELNLKVSKTVDAINVINELKAIVETPVEEIKEKPIEIITPIAVTQNEVISIIEPIIKPIIEAIIEPVITTEKEIEKEKIVVTQNLIDFEIEILPVIQPEPVVVTTIEPTVIQEKETPVATKIYPLITINLNDKFRFINELFGANNTEYSQVIEKVNSISSKQELENYLPTLIVNSSWNPEKEVVKLFILLANRRFL